MKRIYIAALIFFFASFNEVIAVVIFSENIGMPSGTTAIGSYTGWQNNGVLTFSGTGDVRNTTVSSGYSGASGGGNVFLTNTVGRDFIISGFDASSYSSITLSFGVFKSTTASNGSELIVEYSTAGNGGPWTAITWPALSTGAGTATWALRTSTSAIPSAVNAIRFRQNGSTPQFRIDDVILNGASPLQPEINLQQPAGTDQACGFTYSFGTQTIGTNTDVTVRIQNLGTGDLNISSAVLSGANAVEFSVQTAPASVISASGFSDMVIRFSPALPGTKTATLTINSDDADESACTIVLSATSVYTACSELIISEYGEPSSGNGKYIEIYNGSGGSVNLANYQLQKVSNGGTWPEFTLNLSGTLNPGQTYVVANNSTDVPGADLYNVFCNWDGDDAVGLAKNISGTYYLVDVIGTDGADPGTGWQVAGVNNATADHTLVRKTSVTIPTTDWTTSAGSTTSNSEWYVRAYGLSNTACHINTCTGASTVGFVTANSIITESNTTVNVQITMTNAPASDVTVNVNDALLGTAAAGADYTFTNVSLSFPAAGSYPLTQSVTVNILDDAISESNENIVLSLDAQCGALIGNGTHTITIIDNETPEGIVINEFGQGSGSQEYVEFVVTGTPGTTIDLRGWIFDDNSGIFSGGYGTQMGIAQGHLKFSDICTWEKVPVGSIIVVYNSSDKNTSIAVADDPTDANLDYVYVVGIATAPGSCSAMGTSNLYFSSDCIKPNNTSYDQYTPPTYTNADWNTIQLRNAGDALQVRSATGGFFHGISYGSKDASSDCSSCAINAYNHPDSLTYGSNCLYFSQGASVIRTFSFFNINDNDYRAKNNWNTSTTVGALETPGTFNNAANQAWILSLRSNFDIVINDQSYTCDLRAFESRYYLDAADDIIFYITNNGSTDHGSFTAQTIIHDDPTPGNGFQNNSLSGTPVFMQKTFAATPTTYNPANYKVEFFYTTQELQDFCDYVNPIVDAALSTSGTNFTPATIKGFLKIYKTSNSDRAWTVNSDAQVEIQMPITGNYGVYHTFEHDGFAAFSGYALGVTITELVSNILPVELANFSAECLDDKIEISWVTASETNSAYFVLERSYDALNFRSIAQLPAAGFSNQTKNYVFTDDNFSEQKQVYYRLKQVDFDGSFDYSGIVTQKCGKSAPLVMVYPTPAHDVLFINFGADAQQYDKLVLYDVTGRLMRSVNIDVPGTMEIDISRLAAGVYILSIENSGGWSYRRKIIKE